MTILLDFIKVLNTKSRNYTDVWIQILACIEEKDKISVFEIIAKKSINLKTFYRVFQFGTRYLMEKDFEYSFFLEKNQIIHFHQNQLLSKKEKK